MIDSPDDTLAEQLSAWMDGELPEAEARFLLRRLDHDADLRSRWERMQVASSCLKGQPWVPMRKDLSAGVQGELAAVPALADDKPGPEAVTRRSRRPLFAWAAAASVAALAFLLVPGTGSRQADDGLPAVAVESAMPAVQGASVASPASADLVAVRDPARPAPPPVANAEADVGAAVRASDPGPGLADGSLALSPTEFPLVESGEEPAWPASRIGGSDPTLEAYLVRHNQMLANDGLGGFVPYLDVVASGASAAAVKAVPAQATSDEATANETAPATGEVRQ